MFIKYIDSIYLIYLEPYLRFLHYVNCTYISIVLQFIIVVTPCPYKYVNKILICNHKFWQFLVSFYHFRVCFLYSYWNLKLLGWSNIVWGFILVLKLKITYCYTHQINVLKLLILFLTNCNFLGFCLYYSIICVNKNAYQYCFNSKQLKIIFRKLHKLRVQLWQAYKKKSLNIKVAHVKSTNEIKYLTFCFILRFYMCYVRQLI